MLSHRLEDRLLIAAQVASSTLLRCAGPRVLEAVEARVEVSSNGVDFTKDGLTVRYVRAGTLSAVTPSAGSEGGGEVLTVVGRHFARSGLHRHCWFGGNRLSSAVRWVSSSLIECSAPGRASGNVTLELSGEGEREAGSNAVQYQYIQLGSLHSIHPSSGPVEGGTVVTCVGSWLRATGGVRCLTGGILAHGWILTSSAVICVMPSHPAGPASIQVDSLDGLMFATTGRLFWFVPGVEIVRVIPSTGPVQGGTGLTIEGTGFQTQQESDEIGLRWSCRFSRA